MGFLDDAVTVLASRAGWKTPSPDADGAWFFHLADGLDFALFALDDRNIVIRGEVAPVPQEGSARDAFLAEAAGRQAGVCRKRPSILALEGSGQSLISSPPAGEYLILYRLLTPEQGQAAFEVSVRDFLNDLAWWKAATGAEQPASPVFDMGMNAMFMGSRY